VLVMVIFQSYCGCVAIHDVFTLLRMMWCYSVMGPMARQCQ